MSDMVSWSLGRSHSQMPQWAASTARRNRRSLSVKARRTVSARRICHSMRIASTMPIASGASVPIMSLTKACEAAIAAASRGEAISTITPPPSTWRAVRLTCAPSGRRPGTSPLIVMSVGLTWKASRRLVAAVTPPRPSMARIRPSVVASTEASGPADWGAASLALAAAARDRLVMASRVRRPPAPFGPASFGLATVWAA